MFSEERRKLEYKLDVLVRAKSSLESEVTLLKSEVDRLSTLNMERIGDNELMRNKVRLFEGKKLEMEEYTKLDIERGLRIQHVSQGFVTFSGLIY
jgi:uncharacterized protein (DUF3084 family)